MWRGVGASSRKHCWQRPSCTNAVTEGSSRRITSFFRILRFVQMSLNSFARSRHVSKTSTLVLAALIFFEQSRHNLGIFRGAGGELGTQTVQTSARHHVLWERSAVSVSYLSSTPGCASRWRGLRSTFCTSSAWRIAAGKAKPGRPAIINALRLMGACRAAARLRQSIETGLAIIVRCLQIVQNQQRVFEHAVDERYRQCKRRRFGSAGSGSVSCRSLPLPQNLSPESRHDQWPFYRHTRPEEASVGSGRL